MYDVHEISHKAFWPGVLVPNSNGKKRMKVQVINVAEIEIGFPQSKFARSLEKTFDFNWKT